MNNQAYNALTIEGDPTTWILAEPVSASELAQPGAPFEAAITSPRSGTLLLSRRAVASVLLISPLSAPSGGGSIWTDAQTLQISWLYLPTDQGLGQSSLGYALPAGTNDAELQSGIATALQEGTFATVPLSGGNELVLNGATLAFAVILPAVPAQPGPSSS